MIEIKDKSTFADKFIKKLLENGFDFMKERELKVYILYLLLEDGQFVNENGNIDFHEMSLKLKISETKVRNLFYEVELKYRNNHNFPEQLINIIEKKRYEVIKDQVKFAVYNPLVKQYFEYEIRKLNGVSDGSFSKNIVTINIETFEKLLLKLYNNSQKVDEIIKKLPKNFQEKITDRKSLIEEFVKEFVKGFSNKSGENTADLVFGILTPAKFLRKLLNE